MIKKAEKMIVSLLPDAIPGVDFVLEPMPDNTIQVTYWDVAKLGIFPGLDKLREMYLKYAARRKKIIPNFDDSDPLPYLAEKPEEETNRRMVDVSALPIVEVINGVAFAKRGENQWRTMSNALLSQVQPKF